MLQESELVQDSFQLWSFGDNGALLCFISTGNFFTLE